MRFFTLATVEGSQRDRVDFRRFELGERPFLEPIETGRRMIVHRPAADRHGIVKRAVAAHQIVLGQDMIAHNPPAPAFARDHPDPIHAPVGAGRLVAGVLDVIPHAHHDGEQFVPDAFVVADGVDLPAPLDPPVAVLPRVDRAKLELFASHLARPGRRPKRHRPTVIARGEENAAAQRLPVGLVEPERLVEFGLRFAPDPEVGARPRAPAGCRRCSRWQSAGVIR